MNSASGLTTFTRGTNWALCIQVTDSLAHRINTTHPHHVLNRVKKLLDKAPKSFIQRFLLTLTAFTDKKKTAEIK
jgi:hypothetical protein